MRSKSIVKLKWLTFLQSPQGPQLTESMRAALEISILQGAITTAEDLPIRFRATASPEQIVCVLARSAQVSGKPAVILELLRDLTPLAPPQNRGLWEERMFLRGFALSRLERSSEADACFRLLPKTFFPRIQIERAIRVLNRGDFSTADILCREVFENHRGILDPYSLCTLLGGWSLALLHLGDFARALYAIDTRRQVLEVHPSKPLLFGVRLYEILLLLEQNNFERAAGLIQKSLAEETQETINAFFLRHLKLRLSLARHDLARAEIELRELKVNSALQKLPQGVLDFRTEEIEWNLQASRAEEAQAAIDQLWTSTLERRDDYLTFRLLLLRAQALTQLNESDAALITIQKAIAMGEDRHYRPGLTWAFFHAAGIAVAAGSPIQARLFLNRGRTLATELRLGVRRACFSYMADVLENKFANASALVSLAKFREIGPEFEYLLGTYKLLDDVNIEVTRDGKREILAEPQLRRRLLRSPGVFFFQKEGYLLANFSGESETAGNPLHSFQFPKRSPLMAAFKMFWRVRETQAEGLKIQEIHKTRSDAKYREDLHASAAKMMISRLREHLNQLGLYIEYHRESGRYTLESQLPLYMIAEAKSPIAQMPKARDRESELLARIAMEPFVATKTLIAEFGISRQALHPYLTRLSHEGRIRTIRRGPVSGYIYCGER